MKLLFSILFISLFSTPQFSFAGKSIVDIYKKFEQSVEKMCEKKYDRKVSQKCISMIIGAIEKDCGSNPWESCMFDDNGDYIEAGSRNWTKVQNIINKAHKELK